MIKESVYLGILCPFQTGLRASRYKLVCFAVRHEKQQLPNSPQETNN